ncbi:Rhomboid family proteins [Klebsormidium nitens]|uniref:Rhomboid family proteins n=1 Tax=Klebsormidium nitens TaxID=105231 RepID=A0A0U9HJG7_KLENI|nr:Rhomboid family proteins [Klebsormidium nitens]|eukprot:GAQ81999.1 Rhomboid family proteins [Klebsormidium nitens]
MSFGLLRLNCGVAALGVATIGRSKLDVTRGKGRSSSSRREWERSEDREPHILERLLAPFRDRGRFWTNVFLAANIVVFMGQLALGSDRVVMWGAKVNEFIDQGQYWRFITANFLHSGVSHLLMNCYSLNNVGPSWERIAGAPRFLTVYAAASLATVLASYSFTPQPSVGASGAIFGLVGALTVFSYRYMRLFRSGEGRELFNSLVRTVAVNALLGVAIQRWDNWGHAGGFLGGAAAAWILGPSYEVNYYAGLMVDRPPLRRLLDQFDKSNGKKDTPL